MKRGEEIMQSLRGGDRRCGGVKALQTGRAGAGPLGRINGN